MNKLIKVGLGQVNPTIADVVGNTEKVIEYLIKGKDQNLDILAFPELVTIGYPAQDLLFRPEIIEANITALNKIAPHTKDYMAVVLGYCQPAYDKSKWRIDRQHLYNAYCVFSYGQIIGRGFKICLPAYGVFDDFRYFIPGKQVNIFEVNNIKFGVEICEDLWYKNDDDDHPIYPCRPTKTIANKGADLILVLNASPYHVGKELHKENMIREQANKNSIPIFYVNMWGGNDKIIFDGNSMASDKHGNIFARAKSFNDDLLICELNIKTKTSKHIPAKLCSKEESIYNALITGKRDYHKKCSIMKSVVGISGGIDSATVLAIDVKALGKNNVLAIISPSRYSSKESFDDAVRLCKNFEVKYLVIPIEENDNNQWIGAIPEKYKRYIKYFDKPTNNVVFENIQAIDRMSILRAIANEENRLISGTGNKSELAMGYATICGDLQADILVIGDLYKQQVFALAKYINALYKKDMIPKTIIERIPSAELSKNQIDPFDYKQIDEIIRLKIEEYIPDSQVIEKSSIPLTNEEVQKYSRLIDLNEHKRFKSGYILKISPVAFGEDRRINTAKKVNLW